MKEIIITSSVLILCIMLIRIIFKGKISSRLQYALWLLVALRLMIPASAQIYMAIGSLEEFRIMDLAKMLEEKVGDVEVQLEQPVTFATSVGGAAGELAAEYILEEYSLDTGDGPTSVFIAGKTGFTWLEVLRGIWLGGMVVVALWMATTNIVFMRRLRKGRKEFVLSESICENLSQDGKSLAASAKVKNDKWSKTIGRTKIYIIEGLASPALYGAPFREAIYLTPDIAEDRNMLRHVLTHEMCHKKHGDSFWSILRSVLLVIYWMNPLVWVAAILSKRDCELACDEKALLILGEEERISYGETLLSIITKKGKLSDIACTATTMTGSGKSVKERIKFIAQKPRVLGVTVVAVLILVITISVFVFTKSPLFHGYTWEGEATFTVGDMQIKLPETIAGISGYDTNRDGDIIFYQIATGKEVGRFREVSYGEAVMLLEQGREIVPIGDYGRNPYLKVYMESLYYDGVSTEAVERVQHNYTPRDMPTDSEDVPEGVPGTDSNSDDTTYIIGDESDNSTIIVEDGLPFFGANPKIDSYGNSYRYYIPSPENTEWEVIPLSQEEIEKEINRIEEEVKNIEEELAYKTEEEAEGEGEEQERMLEEKIKQLQEEIKALKVAQEELKNKTQGVIAHEDMYVSEERIDGGIAGSDANDDTTVFIEDETTYVLDDESVSTTKAQEESTDYPVDELEAVESIDYLPNEEIIVTYTPGTASTKCYIYVKGDYTGIRSQYLDEMDYINSELEAVAAQIIVTDIN